MSNKALNITIAICIVIIYLLVVEFPAYVRERNIEWNTLLDSGWPEETIYQETTTPTLVRKVILGYKTQIGLDKNEHMRIRKVGVKIPLHFEYVTIDSTQAIRLEE